ncbi:polyketide cyclase/dehydrase/lipid transport protein [Trinickia symbiotica]|uniref:Polyketide cyclase n=2 Tax=Trinickia symbiotica TaxID=863227 RepID=A0A2N7XBA6_9BURK|nr:polyketide cyclase [Trinickia symbiotica]PPK46878.1 polyketide cyclase/dehydrase/lipid transport protein [Trinickia symbiotica]
MPMAESKTISVSIQRSQQDVYDFTSRPASFAQWASGLGKPIGNDGPVWRFEAESGPVKIRFTELSAYGVLDHYVELPDGTEIYVPMRVISNGTGTEVQFTLFRVPGMIDEKFAADAEWVMRDLKRLKELLEAE